MTDLFLERITAYEKEFKTRSPMSYGKAGKLLEQYKAGFTDAEWTLYTFEYLRANGTIKKDSQNIDV